MLPLEREVFSPAIYPGTNFMFELNRQLEYFVQYKINTDSMYKRVSLLLPY
jgi:5'-3' exonuclease